MIRKGNTTLLLVIILVIGGGIWAQQQGILEMPESTNTGSGDTCDYSCLGAGECSNFGGTPVSGDCDTGICCQVSDSGSDNQDSCAGTCTDPRACDGEIVDEGCGSSEYSVCCVEN